MENDIIKTLNNIRMLRAATKELNSQLLKEIISKLQDIAKERQQEEKAAEKAEKERLEKVEKAKAVLAELGVSIADLTGDESQSKKERIQRPKTEPKYQIQIENGDVVQWNGQGRKPKAIAEALENGAKLDDLLIKIK